jgi:hypothetical protein
VLETTYFFAASIVRAKGSLLYGYERSVPWLLERIGAR